MKVVSGSPKSTVTIWTPDTVYELHSDVGNPNKESDVIAINVSKNLNSITGTFTLTFTPRPDSNGKSWNEKLHVFDYVEIKLKGGRENEKEKVVCRGLIDQVGISESYGGGIPSRLIQITGRDLGSLLTDFNIYYLIGYEPWANLLKVFSWKNMPTKLTCNAQEAFDLIMGKWKELVGLTVGQIKASSTGESKQVPRSLNLADKVDYKALAFFPDMLTMWEYLSTYEGSIFNALEIYHDKPFHELFMYEGTEKSMFIMRPADLKDIKGNFPLEVSNVKKGKNGPTFYPPDIKVEPVDIISLNWHFSNSQMYNYFFTTCKLSPLYGSDFLSVATMLTPDRPWDSINPFISIKNPNNPNESEPLAWIDRYGLRKLDVSSNFISYNDALGEIERRQSKESGRPQDMGDFEVAKDENASYVKPSTKNKSSNSKIEPMLVRHDDLVQKSAKKWGMEPAAVYAMMTVENGPGNASKESKNFDRFQRHTSSDWGLMQINDAPSAHHLDTGRYPRHDGVANLTDPADNIDYGSRYFSECYNNPNWKNDPPDIRMRKATDAYNLGPGRVEKAITDGTWPSYNIPKTTLPDVATNKKMEGRWRKFSDALVTYGGSLSSAAAAKKEDQDKKDEASTQAEPNPSGAVPIRDVIREEYVWFGLRLNQVLVTWYLHNHLLRTGSMSIRGTNTAQIGTYVHVVEEKNQGVTKNDYEYYIEGVTHDFRLFEGYTCDLTLTRGQRKDGGLFKDGYTSKFYFDTTRTVEETSKAAYAKLSEDRKNDKQSDEKNVPMTPEEAKKKIHPEA